MKPLLLDASFPKLVNDITVAKAQIDQLNKMPDFETMSREMMLEVKLWHVYYLISNDRSEDAAPLIDTLVFDESYSDMPRLYVSWLWLARMTIFISNNDHMLALGAAENALLHLVEITNS